MVIAGSAILSIFSIVLGQLKWIVTQKEDFMPFKGKLLISAYTLVSVLARTSACILFFAPSLGLGNLLMHWKMGALEATATSGIYDNRGLEVLSLVYDVQPNQTRIFFSQVWRRIENYESLTFWSLGTYMQIFIVCIVLHFLLIFALKCFFYKSFR